MEAMRTLNTALIHLYWDIGEEIYQQQFSIIHYEIMKKIDELEDWKLVEAPKAFT